MVTLASQTITANVRVFQRRSVAVKSIATTGSISSGANALTVANAAGLAVNDWIIVETGGEAGAGARGTKGVGGSWPSLSYANAAAMTADATQAANICCWLEDTGNVYWYQSSVWTQVTSDYYLEKAIPRALCAQITAINGSVLTLSVNAAASATNANVYFDNWGLLQAAFEPLTEVSIPAGTYMMSCHAFVNNCPNITIKGAGQTATILKTPKGTAHGGIDVYASAGAVVEHLQIDAGFKNTGYSMRWLGSRAAGIGSTRLFPEEYRDGSAFGIGIYVNGSSEAEIRDCRVVNPGLSGIQCQFLSDAWVRRCTVRVEDPFRTYTQWMVQFPDVTGGGAEDCYVDADWLTSGFECFKSRNVTFIRCTGRNALAANNASDGALFEELAITVEEGSKGLSHFNPVTASMMEFSTNVGQGFNTNTGRVANSTFIQEGYPDTGTPARLIGITITSDDSCPVEISGTYDSDPTTPKGLFNFMPAWNGSGQFDGLGVNNSGVLTVEGMRFMGEGPIGWNGSASVLRRMVFNSGGTITLNNSVIDDGDNGTGTYNESGNQTNAAYDA